MVTRSSNSRSRHSSRQKPQKEKKLGTMDVILIIVGAALFAFTMEMIYLFKTYGAVPDTLITAVFAALGGECGIMGWIKTSKERYRDRKWEKEDQEEMKREAQQPAVSPEEREETP